MGRLPYNVAQKNSHKLKKPYNLLYTTRRAAFWPCNTTFAKCSLVLHRALSPKLVPPSAANIMHSVPQDSRPLGDVTHSSNQLQKSVEQPAEPSFNLSAEAPRCPSPLTPTEQEQLHVRVIALENLVVALLSTASDEQLACARDLAAYIAPRTGATPHPLTLHAAAEMLSIVKRAKRLRSTPQAAA